jgi:hypothetical protein
MADKEEKILTFRLIRGSLLVKLIFCSCLLMGTELLCLVLLLYECKNYIKPVLLWAGAQERWLMCYICGDMYISIFPFTRG